jgi:hypothetical protein
MNAPAFDQKSTFPNQNYFKWTLPSKEELKLQIEQLEGELHCDRIKFKRLIVRVAYLTPFWVIILFATWFAWH